MNTKSTISLCAQRRERIFLLLAGLFLGTLGLINLLGVSRFIDLSFSLGNINIPMVIPIGVLPYPITFLCTDIISEFYGKKRANSVVWVGLLINLWILFILSISAFLPPHVDLDPITKVPALTHPDYAFYHIKNLTTGCVIASMCAYLMAQLLDVHLFHFWKNLTKGKHLWLRNNASTLVSQLVDTTLVITLTYYLSDGLPLSPDANIIPQIIALIFACYTFKALCALLDTIPFYLAVIGLSRYFGTEQTNNDEPIFSLSH